MNRQASIAAHIAAHEKKIKATTRARVARAMRNKRRGLQAAIERMK